MTSIIANNSSTAPLNGSAVFFGGWQSTTAFQAIKVSVLTDAIGTLIIQHATANDPETIVFEDTKAVDAGTETFVEAIVKSAFFRVKFENGTDNQTAFNLQTTSGLQYSGDTQTVDVVIDADDSSIAVYGQKPDTSLAVFQLDASGSLLVSSTPAVLSRVSQVIFDGNTLNSDGASPEIDVSAYGKCVLTYSDTSSASNDTLSMYAGVVSGELGYIGEIIPIVNTHTLTRYASVPMDLTPFTIFVIVNQTANSIGGISAKLFGAM